MRKKRQQPGKLRIGYLKDDTIRFRPELSIYSSEVCKVCGCDHQLNGCGMDFFCRRCNNQNNY